MTDKIPNSAGEPFSVAAKMIPINETLDALRPIVQAQEAVGQPLEISSTVKAAISVLLKTSEQLASHTPKL